MTTISRPVWRSFRPKFLDRAASHVRAGGFAAVFDDEHHMKVLLPREKDGSLTELSLWALLSLDLRRWGTTNKGPTRGLGILNVKLPEDRWVIRRWCERDSAHPRSRYRITLDCLACGACCRDNHVVLEPEDFREWKREGREDLSGRAYVKTKKGQVVLKAAKDGACVHLGRGNLCGIYALRPGNCSAFPAGSEACLSAREDTLGIVD